MPAWGKLFKSKPRCEGEQMGKDFMHKQGKLRGMKRKIRNKVIDFISRQTKLIELTCN